MTPVAAAVAEQTNGTAWMYSERDASDGSLIKATSLQMENENKLSKHNKKKFEARSVYLTKG